MQQQKPGRGHHGWSKRYDDASACRVSGFAYGLLGLVLAASLLSLTACAPPPSQKHGTESTTAGGREIIPVAHKAFEPYVPIAKGNRELLEAQFEPGHAGGTFYAVELGDGPKTFNTWAAYDATSSSVGEMLLAGLVDTNAYTGEPQPYLAKSVEVLPDRKTYRVTLRRGLTWSDGHPLTADDVVFTWKDIIGAGLGNPSSRDVVSVNGQFPQIRKLDAQTVEFKTAAPFSPFLRNLSSPIAPKHKLEKVVRQGDKAFSAAWSSQEAAQNPERFVSCGRWILERYDPVQQRIVYKKNPHFFMVDKKGQSLPYLQQYVVSFVKDLNNLQLQFEQGKTDVYSVPARYVSRVRQLKAPDFRLYDLGADNSTLFLAFNLNPRKDPASGKPFVASPQAEWFQNVHFRRAIDWAINREQMIANILEGIGKPLFTPMGLTSIYLNQSVAQGHPRDLEKAKVLLKEGGFGWNAKKQLVDASGHPVSFTLYTNTGNDQREATGVAIQQDLADLGIQVNFKPMEFNVLINKMNNKDWEAIIMGLTGSPLEPNSGANIWKSDGALHLFNQREVKSSGAVNLSDRTPWEREIDELYNEAVKVFKTEERKPYYDRFQQIVADELPMIHLYAPQRIHAVSARLKNVDPTQLGGATHNLEALWVSSPQSGAQAMDKG
ncbi:MAG: ABC transporter substrate-binding protein [Candidatus Melainabacteria bacterium]|nr:ABC transporter substrate-binding protein [Candidatus Melainabacteria bacterium]